MNDEKQLVDFKFEFEGLDACPLCENKVMIPNGKVEWLEMDFWYVVCPTCGLKFMDPRPTQSSYQEFYKERFWQQKVRNLGFRMPGQMWGVKKYQWDNEQKWDPKEGVENKMEKLRSLRIDVITDALKQFTELNDKTEILEVGCSFPVTLEALRKNHNASVFDIEPSLESQAVIKEMGIELLGSYGEELERIRNTKKFDVIIFSHSLENTSVPFAIMEYARDALKDSGIIYVQCSNLQTYDQMNPYHPYIFSNSAFQYLADKLSMKYKRLSSLTDRMLTTVFQK